MRPCWSLPRIDAGKERHLSEIDELSKIALELRIAADAVDTIKVCLVAKLGSGQGVPAAHAASIIADAGYSLSRMLLNNFGDAGALREVSWRVRNWSNDMDGYIEGAESASED